VERNTYSNWESDINDVKSEYIPKLAEIFGVEIADLFRTNSSRIEIKQENKENRDNSVNNSIVFILPDKESVDKLSKILKTRLKGEQEK